MGENYNDFFIRVRPWKKALEAYPIEVVRNNAPTGQDGTLVLDFRALASLEYDLEAYGEMLYKALFNGPTKEQYNDALTRAEYESKNRLRVRLWLEDTSPQLHAVNWERLYHYQINQPLPIAVSGSNPFSRYTSLKILDAIPLKERPVQIVVAISNPADLKKETALESLKVEEEIENLLTAFNEKELKEQVKITLLPGQSGISAELRKRLPTAWVVKPGPTSLNNLLSALKGAHVLHFLGPCRM
ncbi:MAG: hypothetical protein HXX20_22820 [Chloroflexi bacterium]|nr:hypothetical protein [Chloroflexota bacterium]